MIFENFDDFCVFFVRGRRGQVSRYEHIYFSCRSRCVFSVFAGISLGLKTIGVTNTKIRTAPAPQRGETGLESVDIGRGG